MESVASSSNCNRVGPQLVREEVWFIYAHERESQGVFGY